MYDIIYAISDKVLLYLITLLNLCSMQSIIWFLARWSSTYLMSSDGIEEKILDSGHHYEHSSKKALLSFFGEHNQGRVILDIIVRISLITLTSYPGEKNLQVCVLNSYHIHYFGCSRLNQVFDIVVTWSICIFTNVKYTLKLRCLWLQSSHAYVFEIININIFRKHIS